MASQRLRIVTSHLHESNSPVLAAAGSVQPSAAAAVVPVELPPDGLFREGWERAFDGGAWERDGVLVLPDVLTDAARGLWLASLQRLQRISDTIVRETPWADAAAWAPLGLVPTSTKVPVMLSAVPFFHCSCCADRTKASGVFWKLHAYRNFS